MDTQSDRSRDLQVKKALKHLRRKGWVSLRQFGYLVGISYPTVLKYKEQCKFVHVRVGHTGRVDGDEVVRFLSEGTSPESKGFDVSLPKGCAELVFRVMQERREADLASEDSDSDDDTTGREP